MEAPLTEKHNVRDALFFRLKIFLLRQKRQVWNVFHPVKKFGKSSAPAQLPLVSRSASDLWNPNDNDSNRILTAGKVQNLRIARQQINGTTVKAGEVFSFWKHIGRPAASRGYVTGREIREGCIVPTIAGGLCQLSNALYDAALKAGFEIVERHRHTRVVKGSLAEQDRDATVKWNYIDLRFRATHDFRIDVTLTDTELVIEFRGLATPLQQTTPLPQNTTTHLVNDCYACGNTGCYRHQAKAPVLTAKKITTFVLDEKWPEYDQYIASVAGEQDVYIVPLRNGRFLKAARYSWNTNAQKTRQAKWQACWRALRLRYARKKQNVFSLSLQLDRNMARNMARQIPPESTHLVVSQNLLPWLWETGAMGGRTFEVLMTRLPMSVLHAQLDGAHRLHNQSTSLNDFRAPRQWVQLEQAALHHAQHIITPHTYIASLFRNKTILLQWSMPEARTCTKGKKLLFPAAALGRKGAYEMRQAAKALGLSLVIKGTKQEGENFWQDIPVTGFDQWDETGLVIYPAWVEHQPRVLLQALCRNIPVIATTACGLPEQEGLVLVKPGEVEALIKAVTEQLHRLNAVPDKKTGYVKTQTMFY